jgi:hypothetical protein
MMKLTLREKILITILLAVLASWLGGCSREHYVELPDTATADGMTDAAFLQRLYATDNESYFHNRLPKVIKIDMLGSNQANIADTFCDPTGLDCVMHFNDKFSSAPRVAALFMLHEQCHIKTWTKDRDSLGQQIDHGRDWRTCMVGLDAEGAFRQLLIDNYGENN